jgi:hypothetical protein
LATVLPGVEVQAPTKPPAATLLLLLMTPAFRLPAITMLTSAKLTALGRKLRDFVCFMTSLSQNKKNHLLIVTS